MNIIHIFTTNIYGDILYIELPLCINTGHTNTDEEHSTVHSRRETSVSLSASWQHLRVNIDKEKNLENVQRRWKNH